MEQGLFLTVVISRARPEEGGQQLKTWYGQRLPGTVTCMGLSGHKLGTSTPVCHWYNVHYSCVCLGGDITKSTQIAWHKVTSDVCIVPWDWQSGSSTQIIDQCFHSRPSSAGSGWSQSCNTVAGEKSWSKQSQERGIPTDHKIFRWRWWCCV